MTAAACLQPYSSKIGRSACSLTAAAAACVDNRWTQRFAFRISATNAAELLVDQSSPM